MAETRSVRCIVQMEQSFYARVMERVGFRAMQIMRDRPYKKRYAVSLLAGPDRKALQQAYQETIIAALDMWLKGQEK